MKTLYIVRHAKSSWEFNVPDDQRPLIEKGISRTHKIGNYLQEKETNVDLIISSYAVRAFKTAQILASAIGYPEDKIRISQNLYHATSDRIYDELYGLEDDIKSVMIFGHNPTFTSFANHFLKQKIDWLPTSGLVAVNFLTDHWIEISSAKHEILFTAFPKDL